MFTASVNEIGAWFCSQLPIQTILKILGPQKPAQGDASNICFMFMGEETIVIFGSYLYNYSTLSELNVPSLTNWKRDNYDSIFEAYNFISNMAGDMKPFFKTIIRYKVSQNGVCPIIENKCYVIIQSNCLWIVCALSKGFHYGVLECRFVCSTWSNISYTNWKKIN